MNEVRFRFHLAVTKFYLSIMNLLSEKCNELFRGRVSKTDL